MYLYHYYPLRDIHKLNEIDAIENQILENLIDKYDSSKKSEPFGSLYRATYPIAEKKIWVSHTEELNDPYECLSYVAKDFILNRHDIIYQAYKNSPDYQKNPLEKNIFIQEILKEFESNALVHFPLLKDKCYGIFSLCLTPDEPLMWSHYANIHQGICVRFKAHKQLHTALDTREITAIKYDNGPGLVLGKIDYGNEITSTPFILNEQIYNNYEKHFLQLNEEKEFRESKIKLSVIDLIAIKIILIKYLKWNYEQEFRLITLGLEKEISLHKLTWPNSNEPILEPDAIIFGLNTSPHAKKIIQNSFGNEISFYESYIQPGTYKLGARILNASKALA